MGAYVISRFQFHSPPKSVSLGRSSRTSRTGHIDRKIRTSVKRYAKSRTEQGLAGLVSVSLLITWCFKILNTFIKNDISVVAYSLVSDKETPCTTLVVCKVKCVLVRIVSYCKSEVLLSEVMCQFTQFKKHKVCHVTKSPLLSRDCRSRVQFLVPQWDLHLAGSHTA